MILSLLLFCRGLGNISLEEKQNMWSVERGYSSEEFKRDEEMYPRPGVGNQELKIIKNGKIVVMDLIQ